MRSMESKGDFWMDMPNALSASSVLENQGSGDCSSHDGSLPSCSSTSSERNSSVEFLDGAANVSAIMKNDEVRAMLKDDEVRAMLKDDDVRAMLKKVTINEGVLNKAIESLGGGEKGLNGLMGYIMMWVKLQRDITSSSLQQQPQPLNPAWSVSSAGDATLQPNSVALQILSGILQPPAVSQGPEQDVKYIQRFKSRKLMIGEPEISVGPGGLETGFCPSSFISSPGDCKLEMASPGAMTAGIPQLSYGMHQQHPVTAFEGAYMSMPFAEQTPAMTTKAARRHRMARQRQSFHARTASVLATSPVSVSVGGGPSWSNAAAPPVVTSSGMTGGQAIPQSAPATAARKGRSMDWLTVLLEKELRPSDVGNLGRIILPKKEAEQHMPFLVARGGIFFQMEDFDTGHVWNLRFSVTPPPKMGSSPIVTSGNPSFWPNNKSRMYVLENTGEFVKSHRLVEGDLLIIYRIQQGGYVLRGKKKKKSQRIELDPVQVEFAHSSAKSSLEGPPSPKEKGSLIQRLYGGCPSDKSVKEEPVNLDDDPFLNDMILSMGPSLESGSSCIQPLERFPSLNLDFPFDEIMAGDQDRSRWLMPGNSTLDPNLGSLVVVPKKACE